MPESNEPEPVGAEAEYRRIQEIEDYQRLGIIILVILERIVDDEETN